MIAMKKILVFALLFSGFGLFAQEKQTNGTVSIERKEIGCIIQPRYIEPVRIVDVNYYFRAQILQPTTVNEQPNGTMPLSKDLPYVQTIRGAVYTFDYIRYTARN